MVQWNAIRLMLILEVILDLKSNQADVTAAFLYVDLPAGDNIYLPMPRGLLYTKEKY